MQLQAVDTVGEALDVLHARGPDCQVLAGGTDVMIQLARGDIKPGLLLHVERIAKLRDIAVNGTARIAALATHLELAEGILGPRYRSVAEAAATVGGLQTQAVGTIGGNICNASPAADTLPALLVHDASVSLRRAGGERTLPLQDFLVGRRSTAREPDELLTEVTLPDPGERSGDVYLKVGRRSAMEVAIVGLAVRLSLDAAGRIGTARVAVASVGPRAFRSTGAEAALVGSIPGDRAVGDAAAALLADVSPVDDLRGSAEYRRRLIPGLLRRAVLSCAERAHRADTDERSAS